MGCLDSLEERIVNLFSRAAALLVIGPTAALSCPQRSRMADAKYTGGTKPLPRHTPKRTMLRRLVLALTKSSKAVQGGVKEKVFSHHTYMDTYRPYISAT